MATEKSLPPRPSFNDPSLRETFESAAPHIDGFQANLDAISADIKALEKYLEASPVRIPITVRLDTGGEYVTEQPHEGSSVPAARDWEYLEWGPAEVNERWRVLFRSEHYTGWWDEGDWWFESAPESCERRPLIETPTEVRLRTYAFLPRLLEAVANKVKVDRLTSIDEF